MKGTTCLVDLHVSNTDGLSQTALWHGNTWRELVSVISISHLLVTLKVRNNDLGAMGARFLGSALLTMPALKHLDIGGNFIGNEGAHDIAFGLVSGCPTLQQVDLDGNNLTDIGMRCLAMSLGKLPSLHHLDLSSNSIGQIGALTIKRFCLHLQCCDFRFNTGAYGDLSPFLHTHLGAGALWGPSL